MKVKLKVKRKRQPTFESVLRDIRVVLRNQMDANSGGRLWDVLTALRGPDDADPGDARKFSVTAVIRHHFLKSDKLQRYFPLVENADSETYAKTRREMVGLSHFTAHGMGAFAALGLKWHEVNE